MQVWTEFISLVQAIQALDARSASAAITAGHLPPSSRITGVRCGAAAAITALADLRPPGEEGQVRRVGQDLPVASGPPSVHAGRAATIPTSAQKVNAQTKPTRLKSSMMLEHAACLGLS